MNGKAILILLLLVGALVAVLMLTDEQPTIEKVDQGAVLDGRSLSQARKIRWQFRDKPAVELGRDARGRLQIMEPIVDALSEGYFRNICTAWDSARMHVVPIEDDEQGRENAGLAPPVMKLVVEYPDDARFEIEVGDEGPLGETHFLRRGGKIWEGGSPALTSSLRVGLDDLREARIFRNEYTHAQGVRVEQMRPSGKREAVDMHVKEGRWMLREPVQGRADPVAARRFVTGLLGLRVTNFLPGSFLAPDRDPDLLVFVKGLHGDEQVKLWQQQGQIYGQLPDRRGIAFNTDNQQYSQVFVNLTQELRARMLVPMGESTFEELLELVVDPGQDRGDRVRLVRRNVGDEWKLVEPIEYATHATPISEAAYALQLLVASEFVTEDGVRPRAKDPRYGLGAGRWMISTRRNRETEVRTLWFGGDAPSQGKPMVYACRADEPDNVALVPKQALETLQRVFTEYCSREILAQSGAIERLDLEHRDGRKRTFLIEDGEWVLQGDGAEAPNQERPEAGDLALDILPDLRGKRVVDMRKGFAEQDWTLVLLRRNMDALGLLKIWDREGKPLLLQGRNDKEVGHEVSTSVSRQLRELWN